MDSEANFVDQLSVESSATFTSTFHPVDQLSVEDNLTAKQHYIDLASALSEEVPSIAPALQKIVSPSVTKTVSMRFHLEVVDTELVPPTAKITRQEIEQINTGIQTVAKNYSNMLMKYYDEPLRQAHMSFNMARRLVLGLLLLGTVLIIIGVIIALTHNAIIGMSTTIGGGLVEIIGIARAFNKEANDRLDPRIQELVTLTKYETAMQYIEKIEDIHLRDNAIAELAKNLTKPPEESL